MKQKNNIQVQTIKIPAGRFCGNNCADGCIYWNPYDKDGHGRQYCAHYRSYFYARDRQGCLSFKG